MTKRATPSGAPVPDPYTVNAIRAVCRGTAGPGQQRRAIAYLLEALAGVTAIEAATIGAEERAFVAGRRWVGMNFAMLGGVKLLGFEPDEPVTERT